MLNPTVDRLRVSPPIGRIRHRKIHLNERIESTPLILSRCPMYGIFTYLWLQCIINVGEDSIYGAYGLAKQKCWEIFCLAMLVCSWQTGSSVKFRLALKITGTLGPFGAQKPNVLRFLYVPRSFIDSTGEYMAKLSLNVTNSPERVSKIIFKSCWLNHSRAEDAN